MLGGVAAAEGPAVGISLFLKRPRLTHEDGERDLRICWRFRCAGRGSGTYSRRVRGEHSKSYSTASRGHPRRGGRSQLDDDTKLSPMQAARMGLVWRIARRLMTPDIESRIGFIDVDPMIEETVIPWSGATGGTLALTKGMPPGFEPGMPCTPIGAGGGALGIPTSPATNRKMKMSSYLDQTDETE